MDLDPSLLPAVDLAVAGVLAACCVWALRWSRPVSVLLSATAVTWLLADVWEVTLFWHRALLSHLVLAYPGWRPPTWGAQGAVVAGYVVCVLLPAVLLDERATVSYGAIVVAAGWWNTRGHGRSRRQRRTALSAAVCFGGAMIVAGVAGLAADDRVGDAGLLVYEVATAVAALVLVTGLQPPSGDRVAGSLIELGQTPAGALRDAVARATRDPDVRVGLWDPDTGCYLAADGIEVDPARAGGERTAIVVWDGDGPVCVVILDAALARDPYLVASVEAAARAMAVNTRRTVEVMAHLRDLEESRRRLVEAADEERAVLQKELRAGLLADIVHLDTEVRRLGDRLPSPHLARGADHLERTTADLADVAAGLRPRELEQGLCPALARLAKSSPLPVRVVGDPGVLPPTIQLTVWFLCSEALTNAVKHARATYLDIALDRAGDRLTVSVRDNGVGGAELRLAGGLAGLRDRVASHRGRLEVTSGTSGTLLAAVLPLDDQRR